MSVRVKFCNCSSPTPQPVEGIMVCAECGDRVADPLLVTLLTEVRALQPPAGDASDKLLTADQVSELIGMRVDYVYALARRDEIPHLRFGRRTLRFRAEAIDEWLRATERGTLKRST